MSYVPERFFQRVNYSAEASDLGWAPGKHPESFLIGDMQFNYAGFNEDPEGDITYFKYVNILGHTATIYND